MSLRVLSLGAGVQSTTLALLAERGVIDKPDVAIFADTHWEPKAVYEHLDWLERWVSYPIVRVSQGDIRASIRARRNITGGRFVAIPWHILNPDGTHGLGRRQCSSEYKLTPIMHAIRERLGKPGRAYIAPGTVTVMLGISRDEAQRMRSARQRYMVNVYPLIDKGMTRNDCLRWLERHGYPRPPKSACIGCPYHDNAYWRRLRDGSPEEWADAIDADRALRQGNARGMRAIEFMHPQRVPLDEANLEADLDPRQGNLFGNECEGMCGV